MYIILNELQIPSSFLFHALPLKRFASGPSCSSMWTLVSWMTTTTSFPSMWPKENGMITMSSTQTANGF